MKHINYKIGINIYWHFVSFIWFYAFGRFFWASLIVTRHMLICMYMAIFNTLFTCSFSQQYYVCMLWFGMSIEKTQNFLQSRCYMWICYKFLIVNITNIIFITWLNSYLFLPSKVIFLIDSHDYKSREERKDFLSSTF